MGRAATVFLSLSLFLTLFLYNNCTPSFESQSNNLIEGRSILGDEYQSGPMAKSSFRRYTNEEIQNRVDSLVGVEMNVKGFLTEESFKPFNNIIENQSMGTVQLSAMEGFSLELTRKVLEKPGSVPELEVCQAQSPADISCLKKIMTGVFDKFFVNPLDESVFDLVGDRLIALAEESGQFSDAIHGLLLFTFQSPRFFYFSVGGGQSANGVYRLSGLEFAHRISNLLTGSVPDSELIDAALSGKLDNPTDLNIQLERLFSSSEVRKQILSFHAMWFGFFNSELPPALGYGAIKETDNILNEHIIEKDAPWVDLLQLDYTYVNDGLAEHYGFEPKNKEGFYKISYSESDQPRKGIFSHTTFLSAFPKIGDSSPTKRGYHIIKNLMCDKIGQPPADVDIDEPPKPPTENGCKKEGYIALRSQTACAGCHIKMDNIGLGLENFDHLGSYRTHEQKNKSCAIDGAGEVYGVGRFKGVTGLSDVFYKERDTIQNCLVEKALLFSYGFDVKKAHPKYLKRIQSKFSRHGKFKQLLFEVISSQEFRNIVVE